MNFDGEGTYEIGDAEGTFAYYQYVPGGNGAVTSYGTTMNSGGEVNVTNYDGTTVNGTFQFIALNVNGNQEVVTVTNGTFELDVTD